MSGGDDSIEVCIASWNTAAATELTVLSATRTAGRAASFTVGDGGSTDRSLRVLGRLQSRGLISLEQASSPRTHAEWLDQWYRRSTAKYLVFVDSDVYFRKQGWLLELVRVAQDEGAAIVAGRIQPDWSQRPRWSDGSARTLPGERPEPALMLIDRELTADVVETSFAYYEEFIEGTSPPKKIGYDVSGKFMQDAKAGGFICVQMPLNFQRSYHHWGGLTWKKGTGSGIQLAIRVKQMIKQLLVHFLLYKERILLVARIGR